MAVEVAGKEIELDAREVRVLGCLIEKELSTPDYYPMTVNALKAACNQKTNREPVVDYSEADILEALDRLKRKRLVGSASGSHERVGKYRHALAEVLDLEPRQRAVLASVMLRGPETPGEIRGRSGRMYPFESLASVDAVVEELKDAETPLLVELPRRPGQKEARYVHLFSVLPDPRVDSGPATSTGLSARVENLEEEVAELKAALSELAEAFHAFKKQFE